MIKAAKQQNKRGKAKKTPLRNDEVGRKGKNNTTCEVIEAAERGKKAKAKKTKTRGTALMYQLLRLKLLKMQKANAKAKKREKKS